MSNSVQAAYIKSGRHLMLARGHTDGEWAEVSAMIDHLAREQFAGGPLVVPKVAGAFLCTEACGEGRGAGGACRQSDEGGNNS